MREDRVRLNNPLPSHSSPLLLSLPSSSLSQNLGFAWIVELGLVEQSLEGDLGIIFLLSFLSIARQVHDSTLLSIL